MTRRLRKALLTLLILSIPLSALLAGADEDIPPLISYEEVMGEHSFEEVPYTAEDALVFARLSYEPFQLLDGEGCTIASAYEKLSSSGFEEKVLIEWDDELLKACAESERYSGILVLDFVQDTDLSIDKQFSAVTFRLTDTLYFVSFRGTDNTVVGWKEDFNMSFISPVPAQEEAVSYLSEKLDKYPGTFVVTGHSKGGNLAIFSASFVPEESRERIAGVFSFDGPGFPDSVLESEGYQRMRGRIRLYVPKSSVIGMLLSRDLDYIAVDSSALSGFRQHDVYTWLFADGELVKVEQVDGQSRFLDQTIRSSLEALDASQREELVDLIFSLAESTGSSTFRSMREELPQSAMAIVQSFTELEEGERAVLLESLKLLAGNALSSLPELLPEDIRRPD